MARSRRGIDRITLNNLSAASVDAAEKLRVHIQHCPDCRPGDNLPGRACDPGWALHKEANRARNTLGIYKGSYPDAKRPVQGELF